MTLVQWYPATDEENGESAANKQNTYINIDDLKDEQDGYATAAIPGLHGTGIRQRYGLQGDSIPLEARIAAVADSFDAMTSGRPYRREVRMTLAEAVAEVERCSGTQFDPAVVRAFVQAVVAGEVAMPSLNGSPGGPLSTDPAV